MTDITDQIAEIKRRVELSLNRCGRSGDKVLLVGVSKRQPLSAIEAAAAGGVDHFGENYLQEAADKMARVTKSLTWHFVGRIQSNKTRPIAENFSWVQTVDRARIADRLNAHRPAGKPPLNVLIQVNVDRESQKGGVAEEALLPLAEHVASLPALRLRGVMGMPPAAADPARNRRSFLAIAEAGGELRRRFAADTVSMGMSRDFELAIECGSTCVRIGTALFGPRTPDET